MIEMEDSKTKYFIYILLAFSYFLACFLRISCGVVLLDVSTSILLTPTAIGLISGMYFYGYVLTQPFCGQWCDTKGPLFIECIGLTILALGLALFALANSITILCLARFLIGIGAGPTFCGIVAYQAKAFAKKTFARLMGCTITLGHLGGVLAIAPLGMAVDNYGYTTIHCVLTGCVVCILFCLCCCTKKYVNIDRQVTQDSFFLGFKLLIKSSQLKTILSLWSIGMLLQMNLIGLWGVIWITETGQIDVQLARYCMSMGGIGVVVGAFLCGVCGNYLMRSPRYTELVGLLIIFFLSSLIICITACLNWTYLMILSLCVGIILGITNVLCNLHLYNIVGPDLIGTVTGASNVVLFIVVLLSQWFSGIFIQQYDRLIKATYISPYAAFFILIVICTIWVLVFLHRKVH